MSFMSVQLARQRDDEDRAVTVRPSATSILAIDSFDRYKDAAESQFGRASPYSFNIARNQNILTGFFKRIALTEIVFPWYIPNINNSTSTMKLIYNGGAEDVVDIPIGFYTPTQLAAVLQFVLRPLTNVDTTVVYGDTGQFVIDVQAGNTILLFPPVSAGDSFSLFDILGGYDDWFAGGDQELIGKMTRCRYTEYVDIVCSQLVANQSLNDFSTTILPRNILARIYLETENDQPNPVLIGAGATNAVDTVPGCFPFTIYRQFANPKQIKWNNTQPIGNLQFEVLDDRGALLTSSNFFVGGVSQDFLLPDWRFTLLVSED